MNVGPLRMPHDPRTSGIPKRLARPAIGKIEGEAAFMPLRGQRMSQPDLQAIENTTAFRIEVTSSGQHVMTGEPQGS